MITVCYTFIMDKEKYNWLRTLSIGFLISSLGIVIAILGALIFR